MSRRHRQHVEQCHDPDCCYCEYLGERQAFDAEHEPPDPQRQLEAADREARMDRWS